jgi:hypothetical protein
MQPVRPAEEEPSRAVGRILRVRRRGLEAEIIDESFWGGPRRRLPLTGSGLVDALVLAVVILAIATVIGLALLWPHGKLDRSGQLGPIRTVGAVAEKVKSVPCALSASHICRVAQIRILDGPQQGHRTLLTTVAAVGWTWRKATGSGSTRTP